MNGAILQEKYIYKLTKEAAMSIADGAAGGLYLLEDGILFDPNNSFINKKFNRLPSLGPLNKGWYGLEMPFSKIANAEIGSFKNLWRTMYTLRIYMTSGEKYIFMLTSKESADKWISEVHRRMK